MIHPSTEIRFISPEIGFGVVATEFIPKGTIVWALDALDQVLTPERSEALPEPLRGLAEKYAFVDGRGRRILCWDHARFVNHSCDANCMGPGFDFELAIRDIQPGEELLDDYGGLNIEHDFRCRCGSSRCRGVVRPDDILHFADAWDASVADAFPLISRVKQPLWPVLMCQDEVNAVLEQRSMLRSTRHHYHSAAARAGA